MPDVILSGMPDTGLLPRHPVFDELDALRYAYQDYGFQWRDDIGPYELVAGVGYAYLPGQMPLANQLDNLSTDTADYFTRAVQPRLRTDFNDQRPKALQIARCLGNVIAANGISGPLIHTEYPLTVMDDAVHVDGVAVPYNGTEGLVVEYGIGIRGLLSHVGGVREGKYAVYGPGCSCIGGGSARGRV